MFSLLFLTGVFLACGGPEVRVEATLDDAAELKAHENLINRIILYQRELLQEQQKRQKQSELFGADAFRLEESKYIRERVKRVQSESICKLRLKKDVDEDPMFRNQDDRLLEEIGEPSPQQIDLDIQENNWAEEAPVVREKSTSPKSVEAHDPPNPPEALSQPKEDKETEKDTFFLYVIGIGCGVAGLVGLIMAGVCWYKLHSQVKAASDVDYPAYGVTGPTKERLPSPGDRKLAQSAQMYHYQHQKQQMIAMEKANGEMKQDASEEESEEENEEGDYTVYECPGLAPTGEMEVRNPLFTEESQTPVNGQPPAINGIGDDDTAE